jgi:flagellar hook assembly protein FlgD
MSYLSVEQDEPVTEGITASPNPFSDVMVIRCRSQSASCPLLNIFDLSGKRVATLIPSASVPQVFSVQWNGTGSSGNRLPRGVYMIQMEGSAVSYSVLVL